MISLDLLQTILGITFHQPAILQQALTHRSYLNENSRATESNERLEFLGDSVLSLITSQFLFEKYPSYPEGKLTAIRSRLVQTKTLCYLANQLEIGKFLLLSRGEELSNGRQNPSLLADTFEAVIGAILLDQGLETARSFLVKHLLSHTETFLENQEIADFKSQLQEITQDKHRVAPAYQVIGSEGPDHAKIFSVSVSVNDQLLGTGSGKSKQEAEQMAAKAALEKIS